MAKTNDFELCQEYLITHLQNIAKQLSECQSKLTTHSQLCPITALPFDQIEHRLKQLVDRERNYLSTRNEAQLIQFRDRIREQELMDTISTSFPLMNGQVELDAV